MRYGNIEANNCTENRCYR